MQDTDHNGKTCALQDLALRYVVQDTDHNGKTCALQDLPLRYVVQDTDHNGKHVRRKICRYDMVCKIQIIMANYVRRQDSCHADPTRETTKNMIPTVEIM